VSNKSDGHKNNPGLGLGAAPRQPLPGEVLRARPVEGEIDWAALHREHIARYPKILVRLAEYERLCRNRKP